MNTMILRTDYSRFELNDTLVDDYGVIYSRDGKKLLKGKDLENYVVKEGTEIICDRAFQSMSFSKITLPNSIKALGVCCFANNKKLEEINFPQSIDYLATNNPFGGCTSLKHINIESDKFIIDNNLLYSKDYRVLYCAFHNFADGSIVEIDSRTKEIAANCFWSHKNLYRVVIPLSVCKIGKAAFKYCKIERIEIKGKIEVIPEEFAESSSGELIELPESVKIVKKRAFHFSNYEKITIGELVEEIEEDAFSNANGIFALSFKNLKTIHKAAFRDCLKLETLIIDGTIKEISSEAFQQCFNLSHIELCKSVSVIKDCVFFQEPQLEKIVIKGRIKEIGVGNFLDCDNLSEICVDKENYFPLLSVIVKHTPRLESIIYDNFYNIKQDNPLYIASLELERAHVKSNALNPEERFSFVKPYLLKFSKEKNKKGWFKRLDYRDYSTTGHSALISSMFINRENVQKILGTSICALNDLGLGYYYYSDELRHHECTALIIQTLVENESYITSIIEECLRILGINNEMKNIKEYVAYIIEFLYPRIININEDTNEVKFRFSDYPNINAQRIIYKRNKFVEELLTECPDFYDRDDYKEKFVLFYTTLMTVVRKHVLVISRDDYNDIIGENNTYIRKIYFDENNYTIE